MRLLPRITAHLTRKVQLISTLKTSTTLNYRYYASKKSKKNSTKENEKPIEKTTEFEVDSLEPKFQSCIDRITREFQSLRIGRANPAILDGLKVDTESEYGILPLNQLAQVSIKDSHTLAINVFEEKFLKSVEKSIQTSDLNLNPIIVKSKIHVPIPKLTSQTRETVLKQVQQIGETTKVSIRQVRQNGMKQISNLKKKKVAGISEDDIKQFEKELQNITNQFNKKVDLLVVEKSKEVKN